MGGENTMEIWKDVIGYEDIYQISNLGRLKALPRVWYSGKNGCVKKEKPEQIMKCRLAKNTGYCLVKLIKNGNEKHVYIHRLVAEAFIPNPNNLPQVNHKDGNKENNCVSNLEWVTAKENIIHAEKMKFRKPRKEYKEKITLTQDEIKWIRENYIPRDKNFGGAALSRKFNVDRSVITNIIQFHTYKNI